MHATGALHGDITFLMFGCISVIQEHSEAAAVYFFQVETSDIPYLLVCACVSRVCLVKLISMHYELPTLPDVG